MARKENKTAKRKYGEMRVHWDADGKPGCKSSTSWYDPPLLSLEAGRLTCWRCLAAARKRGDLKDEPASEPVPLVLAIGAQ